MEGIKSEISRIESCPGEEITDGQAKQANCNLQISLSNTIVWLFLYKKFKAYKEDYLI